MANTLAIAASIAYTDAAGSDELAATLAVTLSGRGFIRNQQTIGTSEEVIALSEIAPGFAILVNLDPTNYVDVRCTTGGLKFARLRANGGLCLLELGPDALAPWAIANTGACRISVFICQS